MTKLNGWKAGCAAFLLLAATANAAPSITLSKKIGPPTSEIRVSGSGFEPNVGVNVYFDTKDEALVVTNNEGEFDNVRIHAPSSAHPGEHWVTALERNNDKGDQKPFVVYTNWRQFHFDNGTRFNPFENVLNPNTVGNLGTKWSYNTVGSENYDCSPAVTNGVVYVAAGNLYALNAATGSLLWSFDAGDNLLSSPAVANGVVYFGSSDYSVYALSARTGVELWSFRTGYSVYSSPAVAEGVVYVGSDDETLYALNATTGVELWRYRTGDSVYSSPVVADGVVYVGSYDHNVYALNARTGLINT
jgi:glucose dehydrogenase